jgi:isocitrate/isopropylmalate dehydrogenase
LKILILLFSEKYQEDLTVRKAMKQAPCLRSCEYYEEEIIRISHLAFRTAQKKQKLTLVDKANILETNDCGARLSLELKEGYSRRCFEFLLADAADVDYYQSKAI